MTDFSNHFLIAMPSIDNVFFESSVIYITNHSAYDGAIGVIINKPLGTISNVLLTDQMQNKKHIRTQIASSTDTANESTNLYYNINNHSSTLYLGGPTHPDKNFILHRPIKKYLKSKIHQFELSNNKDLNHKDFKAEDNFFIAAGYSSWKILQLETEIKYNDWLVLNTKDSNSLIFDVSPDDRYQEAMRLLGINNISSLYFKETIEV